MPSPSAAAAGGSLFMGATTPTKLGFNANGTPNMKGVTLHLGNAAGDATIGDTVAYLVGQTLKQWGANVNFTLGNGNQTELAVVSGQLNATAGPLPVEINAGMTAFGNNQVHVDYILVSKPDITSPAQLKGKNVGIAQTSAPDNLLLDGVLQQAHLTRKDINVTLTGSNGASVNQMAAGKLDAVFVHADGLIKVEKTTKVNVLANSAQVDPWFADSYEGAMPQWIKANPAYAEAIDLAWLHSAKIFNTNKAEWVKAAVAYTKGATTEAEASTGYDALKKADPWPTDGTGMDQAGMQKQYDRAKQQGQIKGAGGSRPVSEWRDVTPWDAAVAVFKAHESAY